MDWIERKIGDKYMHSDFEKYSKVMNRYWKIKRVVLYIPRVVKNTYLVWRFPFLRYKFADKGRLFVHSCWYSHIEYGWRKAFGIQMCKELKEALKRNGVLNDYEITDVKEKYGELNIYDNGAPSEVRDILAKYEYISGRTCIDCGRRAKYRTLGYILPKCEDHAGNVDKEEFYQKNLDWYGWTR